jgi:hypothetical protein
MFLNNLGQYDARRLARALTVASTVWYCLSCPTRAGWRAPLRLRRPGQRTARRVQPQQPEPETLWCASPAASYTALCAWWARPRGVQRTLKAASTAPQRAGPVAAATAPQQGPTAGLIRLRTRSIRPGPRRRAQPQRGTPGPPERRVGSSCCSSWRRRRRRARGCRVSAGAWERGEVQTATHENSGRRWGATCREAVAGGRAEANGRRRAQNEGGEMQYQYALRLAFPGMLQTLSGRPAWGSPLPARVQTVRSIVVWIADDTCASGLQRG